MKLTRVAIADKEYNALRTFDQGFEFIEAKRNTIDPICLVGENGSGKSNLLEMIAELFYHVESDIRRLIRKNKGEKINPKYKVQKKLLVEYKISNKEGKDIDVRIDTYDQEWKLSVKIDGKFKEIDREEIDLIKSLLPNQIIAYSSGENESLSYWFAELDKEYSDEVQKSAEDQNEDYPENTRLVYLNYDANSSIVISNYLYQSPGKLSVFKEFLRINDVKSFRIHLDFNYKSGNNKYVRLSKEHIEIINKLKACATAYQIIEDDVWFNSIKRTKKQPVFCQFDFHVDDETRIAIRDNFTSTYELFMSFRKFELLNSLKLKGTYRKSNKSKNIIHRPPTVGHEDRIFRFDDIYLDIEGVDDSVPYIGISDGQHQFLQVIGSVLLFNEKNILFLLDEPETHFNPQWRSQLVYLLNQKTQNRLQDIILTTHSPFVVSDCETYNVFVFKRDKSDVSFAPIDIETYGTSFDNLLKRTFNVKHTISQKAYEEISKLLKSDDPDYIKERMDAMGPSFEKLPLLIRLKELNPES